MLYHDGAFGAIGLFLLTLSTAALLGFLAIVVAAKGFLAAFRDRLATHLVIALAYLPVVLVVVDAIGGGKHLSTAWGWVFVAITSGWLVTTHSLCVLLTRGRARAAAGTEELEHLLDAYQTTAPIEDYTNAVKAGDSVASVEEVTERRVIQILADTRDILMRNLKHARYQDGELVGWSQFFDVASNPSAIGTAYGLRLMFALNIEDPRLDTRRLVESILALQRSKGGWSARTQRGNRGHLEVTAWVLPPVLRAGVDAQTRGHLISMFEEMLVAEEEVPTASTLVLSVALSALVQVNPRSDLIRSLKQRLIRGAQRVEAGGHHLAAWSGDCGQYPGDLSAAHTARAVLALTAADTARPDRGETQELCRAAIRWLRETTDHTLFDEPIRRPNDFRTDALVVGHFTPAWIARALMQADDLGDIQTVREALRLVVARQHAGVWHWERSANKPIWMAYQGVVAIQQYSLRNLPWPP